jgi:hypothetical protein
MEGRSHPPVDTRSGGDAPGQLAGAGAIAVPLQVSGLVVSTAALVAALRPYLPQLVDITPLDGGQFLLRLADDAPGDNG